MPLECLHYHDSSKEKQIIHKQKVVCSFKEIKNPFDIAKTPITSGFLVGEPFKN
jgi:hypothetical protein